MLQNPGNPVHHAYLPTGSVISLFVPIAGGSGLVVGVIGSDGRRGMTLMLDAGVTPFHAVVQGVGGTLRLSAESFLQMIERSPALQRELKRYLCVALIQLAQTAACTRFQVVEARLARWFLMTHDRARADTFHVTHVFLACMPGVRRVGIAKAASSRQRRQLIRYHRGDITILDRVVLERASCGCYVTGRDACERIVGCTGCRAVDT